MPKITFNADLIDDVANRRVVIFIGSGVSSASGAAGGIKLKSWYDFLQFTTHKIKNTVEKKKAKALLEKEDFLFACEYIKNCINSETWDKLLEDEYLKVPTDYTLIKSIFNLQQRIIVTTNFDKFIETAWAKHSKKSVQQLVINRIEEDSFKLFRDTNNYLVKIHGSVDDKKTMIFSSSDYSKGAFFNRYYSDFIEQILLNYTVLFIGFSMSDPAISLAVEKYANKYPNCRPHYIISSDKYDEKTINIWKTHKKLYILNYNNSNNHKELPLLIAKLAKESSMKRKEIDTINY